MGYRVIDHKADIKIKVKGKKLNELFSEAMSGLLYIAIKRKKREIKGFEKKKLSIEGFDMEDLLVRFLNELIYLISAKKIPLKIEKMKLSEKNLEAEILIAPFKEEWFEVKTELKAATYHNLKIEKMKDGFLTRVVFDV